MNISVDVGRSSVKIAYMDTVVSFPFIIASKASTIADHSVIDPATEMLWGWVDGDETLLGDTARLLGDAVFQHTEGAAFREASVKATLFSVGHVLRALKKSSATVNVAINLTFHNWFMREDYIKALKGSHSVRFVRGGEVSFLIDKVAVLYQGHSGFLQIAMDRNLKVLPEYRDTEGIIIDIGRQTVDLLYVDKMIPRDGDTKDFGTFKLFNYVRDQLKSHYSIVKEAYEIDLLFKQKRPITLLTGEKVDVVPMVYEAVEYFAHDMESLFTIFNASKTPDFVALLGGGAYLYGDYFRKKFSIVSIPENPHVANVIGMLKFLQRTIGG